MTRFMARAEQVGIVCSGEDKGSKCTYALLEERVPPVPELTKDESLARLARSYFRSHAPAVFARFCLVVGAAYYRCTSSYLFD